MSVAAETQYLLREVQGINWKKLLRERWDVARTFAGVKSKHPIYGMDKIQIASMQHKRLQFPDSANRKKLVGEALKILMEELGSDVTYNEFSTEGSNYQFTLRPSIFELTRPFFKFYCHARSEYLRDIIINFSRKFLEKCPAGVKFKVTDFERESSVERFIVYAPVDTNAAGAVSLVLKGLPSDWFFPGRYLFGIEVRPSIGAVLISSRFSTLTPRLTEKLFNAYDRAASQEGSEDELFEIFYGMLKKTLSRAEAHFEGLK